MIIIEASIVVGLVAGVYGIKVLSKKLGYKLNKNKLKKLLNVAFDAMDNDLIKGAIFSLLDFDRKHNSKKLDKYLLTIIKTFRDDEEKPTLNEANVLNLRNEFVLENIFEEDEKEEERQLDEIEIKLEETRQVLSEVDKRRKEVILRKNQIKQSQMMKSRKIRSSGGMG